jgi:hypothetical protein
MVEGKKKTVVLGIFFLFFLLLAYVENTSFFSYIQNSFTDAPLLAVMLLFVHNVLAISLIILAMSVYVEMVYAFMPKRKIEYVILENPQIFALVFTAVILLVSILRASTLVRGQVEISTLAIVVLLSLPNGLVEGYGIFQAIKKTLKRALSSKDLAVIYLIFLLAAAIEVGFVQVLLWVSSL